MSNGRSNLRRRRRLLVKMVQHSRHPLRISLKTGVCQRSCPSISCGVSDFRGAGFGFGVQPYWSGGLPVSGFT